MLLGALRIGLGFVMRADHRAEPADVGEDAIHAAMVADPHLDAGLDQLARDIGLDIGEADRQIGLELQDLADLRVDERGDLRLFLARPRRPHSETGDADDAMLSPSAYSTSVGSSVRQTMRCGK